MPIIDGGALPQNRPIRRREGTMEATLRMQREMIGEAQIIHQQRMEMLRAQVPPDLQEIEVEELLFGTSGDLKKKKTKRKKRKTYILIDGIKVKFNHPLYKDYKHFAKSIYTGSVPKGHTAKRVYREFKDLNGKNTIDAIFKIISRRTYNVYVEQYFKESRVLDCR